jgi:hypothetical protein
MKNLLNLQNNKKYFSNINIILEFHLAKKST